MSLTVLERTRGITYQPLVTRLGTDAASRIRAYVAGREFLIPDAELGWSPRPGAAKFGYHVSVQGLRAQRVYDTIPAQEKGLRLAAFGDSFVYCDELADAVTRPTQLERPGIEVLNFGVPGYGLDQAILRYNRDGRVFHPRVVVIGVYADDVNRGLNVWRPNMIGDFGIPSAKPRYRLADSRVLLRNPLPSSLEYGRLLAFPESVLTAIGSNDYFFRSRERASAWDMLGVVRLAKLVLRIQRERRDGTLRGTVIHAEDSATRLYVAVLQRFVHQVRADGAEPLLVRFPDAFLQARFRRTGVEPRRRWFQSLPTFR